MALGRGDNLSVSIGADSGKLRADLALAQTALREFGRELRTAAAQARQTGETSHLQAVAGRYQAAEVRARALAAEIRAATAAALAAAPASTRLAQGLSAVTAAAGATATGLIGVKTQATLAIAAVAGLTGGLLKLTQASAESVDDQSDNAKALGMSIEEYVRWERAAHNALITTEEFMAMMTPFVTNLGQEQEALLKARGEALRTTDSVTILGQKTTAAGKAVADAGGVVLQAASQFGDSGEILRGTADKSIEAGGVFGRLKKPLQDARGEFKSTTQQLLALDKATAALRDAPERGRLLREQFGRRGLRAPEMFEEFQKLQGVTIPAPTPADQEAAQTYLRTWQNLTGEVLRVRNILGIEFGQIVQPILEEIRLQLTANADAIRAWAEGIREAAMPVVKDLLAMFRGVSDQDIDTKWLLQLRDDLTAIKDGIVAAWPWVVGFFKLFAPAAATEQQQQAPGQIATTAQEIQAMIAAIAAAQQAWTDFDAWLKQLHVDLWAALDAGWAAAVASVQSDFLAITSWASEMAAGILAQLKPVWDFLQRIWSSITGAGNAAASAGAAASAPGLAAGGRVRGQAGIDRVPAWLTAGEYVINAASVRRLGVGFLEGINRFARGGLVGPPRIPFATGGLAAAAAGDGGRPVHLHLGNASFPLSGQQAVVTALVREAHHQQMRSAGVKPSWFAGRPGAS